MKYFMYVFTDDVPEPLDIQEACKVYNIETDEHVAWGWCELQANLYEDNTISCHKIASTNLRQSLEIRGLRLQNREDWERDVAL
jgi:hypothetical protein